MVPDSLDEPAIAIIIAERNEESDLEKALESICNLNYTNYRLLLINDRSTDGTAEILEKFDKRFALYWRESFYPLSQLRKYK